MAHSSFVPAKTQTKVVEVEPAQYVLALSKREAEVVMTLLAHTHDNDSKFPEVRSVFYALKKIGVLIGRTGRRCSCGNVSCGWGGKG